MLILTVDVGRSPKYFCFDQNEVETQLRSLFKLVNINEGSFCIATGKKAKRQRGKPVMYVQSISSESRLFFALLLKGQNGRQHFVDCYLCSANRYGKHGTLKQMKELAQKLNLDSDKALSQLQKYLEDDKEQIRRLLAKMRVTKSKIRALQ